MKVRPVGAELFHADGRTDMTKLIVALRNTANEPKNKSVNAVYGNKRRFISETHTNTHQYCVGRM
jgi:hypothetical protein